MYGKIFRRIATRGGGTLCSRGILIIGEDRRRGLNVEQVALITDGDKVYVKNNENRNNDDYYANEYVIIMRCRKE